MRLRGISVLCDLCVGGVKWVGTFEQVCACWIGYLTRSEAFDRASKTCLDERACETWVGGSAYLNSVPKKCHLEMKIQKSALVPGKGPQCSKSWERMRGQINYEVLSDYMTHPQT